jgi:hypothetical protein
MEPTKEQTDEEVLSAAITQALNAGADGLDEVQRLLIQHLQRHIAKGTDPMAAVLDKLIDDAGGDAVAAQLVFKPGMDIKAGALARGPVPGTYKLGIMGQATKDTPGQYKAGEKVLINIVFAADAVLQVMTFMPTSGIVTNQGLPVNPFGSA